ncbi:protein FAM47E [Paramisgurnus dabryanus]|uniref:protein FAM47E n=1 Tax=Paramisgurnus dabryanus TaxID=90735 RepID=UPI0031F43E33
MSLKTEPVENSKFPWYKERLQTKYLQDLRKKQQLSGALDGRRWRFLSPGLNDFRDGYPTVHKELFTRCESGPAPAVFGMPKHLCSVKLTPKRLSKDQACFSKLNPQSQTQRGFIDAVEHRLKQHPLALYPHLESGMTSKLFDQVLSVLDPDMSVNKELATTSPKNEDSGPQCEISPSVSVKEKPFITAIPRKEKCENVTTINPYKWRRPKEINLKDQMTIGKNLQEDEKLKIARRFCEWINTLGGDTSDLTESDILDLFKSDYEKTLRLTPVKMTDCNKTPAIIYRSADLTTDTLKLRKAYESNRPNAPKTCKKKTDNETWRTPSDITHSLDLEVLLSEQDKELKQSYGIQAFRQYIINKGVEMPRFLSVLFSEEEQKNRIRSSNSAGSTFTSKGRAQQKSTY